MNVVLFEPGEIASDASATLGGRRARHVIDVLRVAVGDTIRVGVIDGALGSGTVESIGEGEITLRVVLAEVPPRPRVDLVLALPRPKVMGRLFSPLAQLGVGRVMLTNAARVERYYFDAHQLAPSFVREQLLEGLAQARDTRLPEVTVHKSFRAVIEDELGRANEPAIRRLLADPGPHESIREALAGSTEVTRIVLAIGPEGGWTPFERDLLTAHGFAPVALGPRTLRTDVAVIALLGLAHDTLGG